MDDLQQRRIQTVKDHMRLECECECECDWDAARIGVQSRRPTKASAVCRSAGISNFRPRCHCARTSQSDTVVAAEVRFVSPIANQGPDPQAHR